MFVIGKKQLKMFGVLVDYEGEMDVEDKACGEGNAVAVNVADLSFKGTWLDDMRHGIGRYRSMSKFLYSSIGINTYGQTILEGEYMEDNPCGKRTEYGDL